MLFLGRAIVFKQVKGSLTEALMEERFEFWEGMVQDISDLYEIE